MCLQLPGCLMLKGTDPKLFFLARICTAYICLLKSERFASSMSFKFD